MRTLHILAFAALLLLSACGQKGPLYHPEPAQQDSQSGEEETEENES